MNNNGNYYPRWFSKLETFPKKIKHFYSFPHPLSKKVNISAAVKTFQEKSEENSNVSAEFWIKKNDAQ